MRQFIEDDLEGSEGEGMPETPPAGQSSTPSPLIPVRYTAPAIPTPATITLPISDCMVSGSEGVCHGQGVQLSDDDVMAIKLIIMRRAQAVLASQVQAISGNGGPRARRAVKVEAPTGDPVQVPPVEAPQAPKKRGRPKGSRNKPKEGRNESLGDHQATVGRGGPHAPDVVPA